MLPWCAPRVWRVGAETRSLGSFAPILCSSSAIACLCCCAPSCGAASASHDPFCFAKCCSRCDGGCVSSCLRTAASKEGNACLFQLSCLDTSARTEPERWKHTRKTTPVLGSKFGLQNGGHITIFCHDGPHFGVQNSDPKMGPRWSGVFGAGALSKDGFRQQVTQWASACLPVPASFLFRHADSCRQLRLEGSR